MTSVILHDLSRVWCFTFCFSFQQIKAIADTGCSVIVSGGKVGELATHFCNKYKILILRLMSKWDLRRLCKAVGATPLPRVVSNLCQIQIVKCSTAYLSLQSED